jgi:hypothetical protein
VESIQNILFSEANVIEVLASQSPRRGNTGMPSVISFSGHLGITPTNSGPERRISQA